MSEMKESTEMPFKVGDQIIHWVHGIGEIVQLDEKDLFGHSQLYYVVQTSSFKLWVPVDNSDDQSLRYPTTKKEFEEMFQILSSPALSLSQDHNERRLQLKERLRDRKLTSICGVIRDLTIHKNLTGINVNDKAILEKSRNI